VGLKSTLYTLITISILWEHRITQLTVLSPTEVLLGWQKGTTNEGTRSACNTTRSQPPENSCSWNLTTRPYAKQRTIHLFTVQDNNYLPFSTLLVVNLQFTTNSALSTNQTITLKQRMMMMTMMNDKGENTKSYMTPWQTIIIILAANMMILTSLRVRSILFYVKHTPKHVTAICQAHNRHKLTLNTTLYKHREHSGNVPTSEFTCTAAVYIGGESLLATCMAARYRDQHFGAVVCYLPILCKL